MLDSKVVKVLKNLGLSPKQLLDYASKSDKAAELVSEIIENAKKDAMYDKGQFFDPYVFQRKFYKSGSSYKRRFLCAANRIGKSFSEAQEVAYHATGKYPDWWEGHQFKHPPLIWCVGITGDSTRKVLQKELFGTESARDSKSVGTGAIPRNYIDMEHLERDGNKILVAKVKWFDHNDNYVGNSTIEFRSTQQGEHVLMGSTVDYIWLDEEDPYNSEKIYAQCVTRTATTGGLVTITATPENGLTPLVNKFMNDETGALYFQNATWDDAPHITPDIRKELLASIPAWQHDMRVRGLPLLGSGLVYTVGEENIKVDPFYIPDHWPRIGGLDVGISHDTACVWSAYDTENDTIYIYDAYHAAEGVPSLHAQAINARGYWIPIVLPHDADNLEKGSGKSVAQYYREANVNACMETFHNPMTADGKLNNLVEPGIMEILTRMKTGRIKVFSTCDRFFEEMRRYHRKDGRINKTFDDTMDAARYSVMSLLAGRGLSKAEASVDVSPNELLDWNILY